MKLILRQSKLLEFVITAHGEQKRKYTNLPYWTHLVSVAEIVSKYKSILGIEIALCHDLLEDTKYTASEVWDFLASIGYDHEDQIIIGHCVLHLTDQFTSEAHPELNRATRKKLEADRLTQIPANAQTVKYADIIDNTSSIVQYDPDFAKVYLKEIQAKIYKMDKGDPELYKRCLETVEGAVKKLELP